MQPQSRYVHSSGQRVTGGDPASRSRYPPLPDRSYPPDGHRADGWNFLPHVHYSFNTLTPPHAHSRGNTRRRRRQRIQNKASRLEQPEETVVSAKRSHSRKQEIFAGTTGLRSLPGMSPPQTLISRQNSHSKVGQNLVLVDQTFSQRENLTVLRHSSTTAHPPVKEPPSLSGIRHLHRNLAKVDLESLQDNRPNVDSTSPGQPHPAKPKAYSHDPFHNAPPDRYDMRPSRQRPVVQTTTLLPSFVHGGSRPKIPDPYFLPGATTVVAHEGGLAVLPCGVRYLEMKQVSRELT